MKKFLRNLARRRSQGGAGVVEFAIVAPILFLFMFTAIDFSLILIGSTVGGNAAREGARVGIINYECAEDPAGCTDHTGAAVNNYALINTAVQRLLGSLVRGTPTTTVRCLDVDTLAQKDCEFGTIDLDRDLMEVQVVWQHIGASPFVSNATHTETARMVIHGKPDLTPPPATTTTTAAPTTTTTAAGPTTTTTTAAPTPTISTLQFFDDDHDGKVDRVAAVFSASVPSCTTGWSVAGVPSSGTLGSPTVSTNTVTLPINEGAGAADTAQGSFQVTFAPGGGCAAIGFTQAPVDKANPVPVSVTFPARGSTAGLMQANDSIAITFSEALSGVPTTATVTEDDSSSNDLLKIPGIIPAAGMAMQSNYIGNNKTATFTPAATNVALSNGNTTITVTVAGTCSGSGNACNSLTTGGAAAWVYAPATSLTDLASNAAAGAYTSSPAQQVF